MSLDYQYVSNKLEQWLQTKIEEAGARGAVVGISGGLDSAVTAVLCKRAFPGETLGVIMPCYSQVEDTEDGRLVADKFDINYLVRDLGSVLDQLLETLEEKPPDREQMAVANIKPRLRMTTLYYYAARNNYLVVGTDNWSELKVGYFTKHGDGG
ncbi:MAG: NAD(+) synthase, partial [Bacillota bacterium]